MRRRKKILTVMPAILALGFIVSLSAQGVRQRSIPQHSALPCQFGGSYRINVDQSDRLYSAVREATSSVPFRDQQQFFMDLSVRLTPPDLLAIECSGRRVSVASSRAAKVTFVADGQVRQEHSAAGGLVNSRISMTRDTLTFTSTGKAEDNLNVVFRSLDGGSRLRVIRRINAEQLTQPVVIQSIYDKISDGVDWDVYDDRLVAGRSSADNPAEITAPRSVSSDGGDATALDLKQSLDQWIEATNQRDLDRQMSFYMPRLSAFYLARNIPRSAVRAEKHRAFLNARSIDIRVAEPEIVFQDRGRAAIMRFRKQYSIIGGSRSRSGEVVQELRWQRTDTGWRIFSERDVRVIR